MDGHAFQIGPTMSPTWMINPHHAAAAHRLHAVIDPLRDLVPFNGRKRS